MRTPRSGRPQSSPVRHYRAQHGTFEEGPHDALPTDVWDPGEDLVPFGGEGSRALQERMVGALTNLMGSEGIETLLAVSHGSASRQFIKLQPQRLRAPSKTPQLRHHDLRFDEESRKQKASQCSVSSPFSK